MKAPSTDIIKLEQLRAEINKSDYAKIVDLPYIVKQFENSYDNPVEAKVKLDQFRNNFMVMVHDKDVAKTIVGADKFSLLNSLINLAKDNLSINPSDKEACIVNYGGKIVGMAMSKGKIKRMQEKGTIKYVKLLETVWDCDKITEVNGTMTFSRNFNPPKTAQRIGAVLMVIMNDGKERHKFVSKRDIELRREHAPSKNIWNKWTDAMYQKTVVNMFEKEIGVATLLYSEFQDEDEPEMKEQQTTEDVPHEEIVPEQEEQEVEVITEEEPDLLSEIATKRTELENKIKNNPGALLAKDIDKLNKCIGSLDGNKLQIWIEFVEKCIQERKEKLQKSNDKPRI